MKPFTSVATGAVIVLLGLGAAAQAPAPAAPAQAAPAPAPAKPAAPQRRAAAPLPAQVVVRDVSGTPLSDVRVTVSGPASRRDATDAQGKVSISLPGGSYRLRFEHDGFITLERDVTVRAGQPTEVEVALSAAPPAPPTAAPEPPPPAPVPPPSAKSAGPAGSPSNVSIPAFLDKNFIGRDPLKESILGCTADSTTRLLQLRDPLATHTHDDFDEMLYVVAGDGAVRIGNQSVVVSPGWLSVIPRGTSHALERRGKNPLIVLSMLAGTPCPTQTSAIARGQ